MKFKIPIDAYQGCTARCPFEKECAQHASAGDFRVEGGFTPELEREDGDIFCLTHDRKVIESEEHYGVFPEGVEALGQGMVTLEIIPEKNTYEI